MTAEPPHDAATGDPEFEALDESVNHALLVVLESLSPAERTAFVLHDVFGYAFDELAEVVGRTPASARQLASRARRHISEQRPRYPATHEEQRRVIEAAWIKTVASFTVDAGPIVAIDIVRKPEKLRHVR